MEPSRTAMPPPPERSPLPPARPAAGGTQVLAGVPFASLPGSRPLELDLWLPPTTTDRVPAVVFLHGGGWQLGSRHSVGPAYLHDAVTPFERLAQAGVAVASVDYRLSGEARWPAQLHDAKAAVRWLRERAGDVGVDPTRIAAWGESAGGHLAALLGLTAGRPDLEGQVGITGPTSEVAAVVAWYPPTDLFAVAEDNGMDPMAPDTREALLLRVPVGRDRELTAQASPIAYVTAAAPPFLLMHGTEDRFMPAAQSERLHAALTGAGVESDLVRYPGANHMWLGRPEAAVDALDRTIAELRRRLTAAEIG